MKIRMLTSVAGYHDGNLYVYDIDTEHDLPAAEARELCEAGQAEPVARTAAAKREMRT